MGRPRQYLSWEVVITRLLSRNISNSQDLETGIEFMTYQQRDIEHDHLQSTSSFASMTVQRLARVSRNLFEKTRTAPDDVESCFFETTLGSQSSQNMSPVNPDPSREPLHHRHLKQDTALPHPLDSVREKLAWKASEEPDPRGPKLQAQHAISKHGADETPAIPQ